MSQKLKNKSYELLPWYVWGMFVINGPQQICHSTKNTFPPDLFFAQSPITYYAPAFMCDEFLFTETHNIEFGSNKIKEDVM